MTDKKILVGLLAIAFVAGSITTGSMAYAAQPNGQPFDALWAAITDIQTQIDNIELTSGPQGEQGIQGEQGQNTLYTVTNSITAQPGERLDVQATCNSGDVLIANWVTFNTFPPGFAGGAGPVIGQSPGNANSDIQTGWFLNLNNRDNVFTNFPVDGEVKIVCSQIP